MDFQVSDKRLQQISSKVNQMVGQRDHLRRELDTLNQQMASCRSEAETMDGIRRLLELLAKTSQESIKNFVEPLVDESIDFVFGYDVKFRVEFADRRNQTEIDFAFTNWTGDTVLGDPKDVKGGGVLDVVAMILRIGLAHILRIEGPIFLDEPTKAVDETHSARVGNLIVTLSHKFGTQIVMITHSQQIAGYADKLYGVKMDSGGVSHVTEGMEK